MTMRNNYYSVSDYLDTVAAVSTPFGKGGVALLRLSGADAIEIADRAFAAVSQRIYIRYFLYATGTYAVARWQSL